MKKLLALILILPFFYSCDDGEIIVKDFNFDEVNLKACGGIGEYVFYKDNPQSFESLSLQLGVTQNLYENAGTETYNLNGTSNFVLYRRYDDAIGNNYFCSSIPPSSPKVEEEYKANSGSAVITVVFEYDRPINDSSLNTPGTSSRATLRKHVQITLKNLVLVKGQEQIIVETLDMGTIENVEVIED